MKINKKKLITWMNLQAKACNNYKFTDEIKCLSHQCGIHVKDISQIIKALDLPYIVSEPSDVRGVMYVQVELIYNDAVFFSFYTQEEFEKAMKFLEDSDNGR